MRKQIAVYLSDPNTDTGEEGHERLGDGFMRPVIGVQITAVQL